MSEGVRVHVNISITTKIVLSECAQRDDEAVSPAISRRRRCRRAERTQTHLAHDQWAILDERLDAAFHAVK